MKRVLPIRNQQTKKKELFSVFTGKKVCLHLHGVFPYLLVKSPTDEIRYGEQLAQSLDMAINLSLEKGDTETKHVYDINLIELLYR
jgi:DNA polymerase zeta